jgi:hypothetical protein
MFARNWLCAMPGKLGIYRVADPDTHELMPVEAIDISEPARPVKLASYKCPEVFTIGRDSVHDLVHRDGYLYVTGKNDNCLCILRVNSRHIRQLAGER